MPSAVFESAIPAIKRLQACALDRTATGIGTLIRVFALDFYMYKSTSEFRCAEPSFEEEEEEEEGEEEEEEEEGEEEEEEEVKDEEEEEEDDDEEAEDEEEE